MDANDIDARVKAVERLINLFKVERMVYLGITSFSLIMLLISAGFLVLKSKAEASVLAMLFGSSGLITYSLSRLLRMWDQALQLLYPSHDINKQEVEK